MTANVSAAQLAGERSNAERDRRRVRRTPPVVVGLLIALTLAVGITGAVDLRRLDSPAGAALSWTEAVTFGDCGRYRLLSAPAPDEQLHPASQVCPVLDQRRVAAPSSGVRVRLLTARPGSADLVLDRPTGSTPLHLQLVRSGRWKVVLDRGACEVAGCP